MSQFKKCVFVDDLLAVTLYSCLVIAFVLIPPFNKTFLRIPLVLPLFIFIPGYSFIAALFPGRNELGGVERFTLSVAFSLVLVIFDGFLISLLPWGYRPSSIVISMLGMTSFFSIAAIFTRKLLNESDQFSFSINEFIKSIETDNIDENVDKIKSEEVHVSLGKRHFQRLINKVKTRDLKPYHSIDLKKTFSSSHLEKRLIIGLIAVIILFSSIQIYLISLLPRSPRFFSIFISLLGTIILLGIFILFVRKYLRKTEVTFSSNGFINSLKSNNDEYEVLERITVYTDKRRFHKSRSKVKARGLKSHLGQAKILKYHIDKTIKNTSILPEIERGLIIGLIVSIILVSGMQVYAKVTQEKEGFTALYLLGPGGKTEGYPTESFINVPLVVSVGIENHELKDEKYIMQMKADDEVVEELNISLKNGETWQRDMIYTREKLKTGKSKLEFALFKENPDSFPYRSVYLHVENNNTIAYIDAEKYAEVPAIENGEMEISTGWEFTSNTYKITGSYVNNSGINSSLSYRIANSYEGNLSDSLEYGEISQSIECKGDTMVLLSAYSNSTFKSKEGTGSQEIYVVVNGESVWREKITENEGWQHLVIPISLHTGNNNLTLGLGQTSGEIKPVEIFLDDISLESLVNMSLYPSESLTSEANPPSSTVLPLPVYTSSKAFNVSWNGTDEGSGISYYSIDASTDGINWQNWIPRTTEISSVFVGEENQTYYFRSKAIDNSGNEEPAHSVADTYTQVYTGTPKIIFDITPNPCKNATNFTVSSTIPLQAVVCLVTRDGFTPESGELTSSDGVTWTGGYVINEGNHFYVEAVCTDLYGNTKSIISEIAVDNSLPDLEIETTPKTIDDGNLEIKVTPSTALKKEPSVSISGDEKVDVTFTRYSDGAFFYKARITSEIEEGEHKVSVTGTGLDAESVTGNTTFAVDHVD